jgi:hypothetical protein
MGVGVGSVVEWNEGERHRCVVAARWIEAEAAKMGTSGYFQKKLRRTREKGAGQVRATGQAIEVVGRS